MHPKSFVFNFWGALHTREGATLRITARTTTKFAKDFCMGHNHSFKVPFSGSNNETFQQFRASHPSMTYAEAIRAWKAKKRGKHLSDPNTMDSGGPHL